MADQAQQVRETTVRSGDTVQTTKEIRDPATERDHSKEVKSRIVWYVAGVLLVLLGFRFVLALLGANPNNGFADFIYDVSYPFVAPFFGLFSYDTQYGVAKLEIFTLVAMAVYAILAYGVDKLVNITRHSE